MPKLAISHQLKRQRLGPHQRRARASDHIMTAAAAAAVAAAATGNHHHHHHHSNNLHRHQQQPNSISSNGREPITGAALDQPADCTIACDKGHITAHKLVLCQHSKYLQDILSKFPQAEHPIVILTELDIIDIKVLVNYMYTGALDITSDTSPTSLLRAAQILKIDSLTAANDDDGDHDHHHDDDVDDIIDNDVDDDVDLLDAHGDHDLVNQRRQQQDDHPDDVDLLDDVGHHNNNNNDDDDDDDDVVDDVHGNGDRDDEDEDEDDDDIDREDDISNDMDNVDVDLSKLMMNQHAINSIKNIYGFLDATKTTPPSPSLLAQAIGQNNNNSNNNGNHHNNTNTTNSNMPSPNGNNINNNSSHHNLHHDLQEVMAAQKGGLSGFGALSSLVDNKNNKIRCHLCNIGLSDVKCLYRHVLTRHLPEKWGYKCEFCDREFSRDDHLMRHYTTKHKKMEFNREKIRETRRLNREMAKNFHDTVSTAL